MVNSGDDRKADFPFSISHLSFVIVGVFGNDPATNRCKSKDLISNGK
jgi:hypothetical protein